MFLSRHSLIHIILHFGILLPQVFSSGGIFQLHIAKFSFQSEFPIQICCSNSRLKTPRNESASSTIFSSRVFYSRINSSLDSSSVQRTCRPVYCQLVLKACLGVFFARTPAPQELLKCTIGQGEIIIPVTGQPKGLEDINSGVNEIAVQGRWQPAVTIILKLFHRKVQPDGQTYEDIRVTQSSLADPELLPTKSWVTRQLNVNKIFNLTVAYRFQCKEGNYGKECDKTCTPRNSSHGHYICGANGEFICLPGWEGAFCNVAICEQGCQNGVCEAPNRCKCHSGWNGSACNVCIPYPGCVHGGCEVKLVTAAHQRNQHSNTTQMQVPLTCVCREGWAGMFCNVDQFYCQHHPGICENGGTCVNSGNGNNLEYTCFCSPGFAGTHCEKVVPSCHRSGCVNNGTCHNDRDRCQCPQGYFGDRCQFSRVMSCEDQPCQGKNSTCIRDPLFQWDSSSQPRGEHEVAPPRYKCICEAGRQGVFCEHAIHECDKVPHRCNGGLCVNLVGGFRCVCPVGMSGQYCQVNVDDCQELSCQNGASCKDQVNSVVCQCKEGFEGATCADNVDECQRAASRGQKLCLNEGHCVDDYGSYHCVCPPGFGGYHCERNMTREERDCPPPTGDASSSLVCLHNGVCRLVRTLVSGKEIIWQQICRCPPGYHGIHCEHETSNQTAPYLPTDNSTFLSILSLASIFIVLSLFLIITFLALAVCLFRKQFCSGNASKMKNNFAAARPDSMNSAERSLMLHKLKENIYSLECEQQDKEILASTQSTGKHFIYSPSSTLFMPHSGKASSSHLLRPSKNEMGLPHAEHTYSELDYPIGSISGGKVEKRYDTFPSPVSSRTSSMKNLNDDCYIPHGAILYNLRKASLLSKSQNTCFCRTYDASIMQQPLLEPHPYPRTMGVIYSVPKLPRRHASLDQDIQEHRVTTAPFDMRPSNTLSEPTPVTLTLPTDPNNGHYHSSTFGYPDDHCVIHA